MSPPDLEALLVALVLAPATYSRNRFFEMYTDPAVRRVRRRAALVRNIVRHVAAPEGRAAITRVEPTGGGLLELTYNVPALGLRRTTSLEPLEAALVRFAIERAGHEKAFTSPLLVADESDRSRIESALRQLAPTPTQTISKAHEGGLHPGLPSDRRAAMEQDPIA